MLEIFYVIIAVIIGLYAFFYAIYILIWHLSMRGALFSSPVRGIMLISSNSVTLESYINKLRMEHDPKTEIKNVLNSLRKEHTDYLRTIGQYGDFEPTQIVLTNDHFKVVGRYSLKSIILLFFLNLITLGNAVPSVASFPKVSLSSIKFLYLDDVSKGAQLITYFQEKNRFLLSIIEVSNINEIFKNLIARSTQIVITKEHLFNENYFSQVNEAHGEIYQKA